MKYSDYFEVLKRSNNSYNHMSHLSPRIYSSTNEHMKHDLMSIFHKKNRPYLFISKNAILSTEYLNVDANMARNDLCICGSGIKQKHCHSSIYENSVLASIWQKYRNLDMEIQRQKSENNTTFLCRSGCNDCCSDYFYISLLEFIAIKNHLLTFDREAFYAACAKAKEQYIILKSKCRPEYDRLENPPSSTDELFNDHAFIDRFLPCPLLDSDGKCIAYAARSFVCRLHGVSSAFTGCTLIDKKKNRRFFAPKLSSFLVDVEYSDELRFNVEVFQKKNGSLAVTRPAPIVYWLSHEEEYQAIYDIACSRPFNEFVDKC